MNQAEDSAAAGRGRRSLVAPEILITASVFLLLLGAWWLVSQWHKQTLVVEERAMLAERLAPQAAALVSQVDERISEIESLAVLARNSEQVTETEFTSFVLESEPGVHNVRLYSLQSDDHFVYVYPQQSAGEPPPQDPRSDPDAATREAVGETMAGGDPVLLIEAGPDNETHLSLWLAVYKGNQLWGFCYNSYELLDIFEDAGLGEGIEGVDLVVRDDEGAIMAGGDRAIENPVTQTLSLGGVSWEMAGAPAGGWDGAIRGELALFRVSSLMIVLLLSSVVYLLAGRQGSLARAVRSRTEELEESRRRYKQLFESSPDALFVIGEDGSVLDANSLAVERYGYSMDEFGRMTVADLTVAGNQERVPGKIQEALAGGASFEWVHRRSDGTVFPVEINARSVVIGDERFIFSSARDISERREAEAALRESEEKFRSLFEESRDAVFISTPEGRFLDMNPAGIRILGYISREELLEIDIGRDLYADPEAREEFQKRMAEQGYVDDYEAALKRKDGKQIDVIISASAHRDDDGMVVAYRGIIRDVTEQRRLSEQLVQAQKMESVGHLAGGVAHDFNNLLTVIRGYVDLAISDIPGDSEAREELKQARKAADRAAELTRQMLLFSRREPMDISVVDLNASIIELLNMLNRLIGEGFRITTSFGERLGLVAVDVTYIEQVIMNLVVNARDAMPAGGEITISTRNARVDREYCHEHAEAYPGDFVRLSISDEGEGIDAETRQRIFEPFFSTKEVGKGTGLGLSVVYGIISQLGGWIEVDSVPGDGSVFHIYLPLADVRQDVPGADGWQAGVPDGHDERVLLIEDEQGVREVAGKILTEHGYRVVTVADADEAEEVFRDGSGEFDLVFSDVVLPGGDGLSLAEDLRSERPGLRVLLASGYVDDDVLRDIKQHDIPFIQKPYTMDQLLIAVRDALVG
ncbi:MAG: PAS domain S-box protein [Gaiellales bacterium]|nr:MAG: PAS domain S-box protein [Gaiellales bacterium]